MEFKIGDTVTLDRYNHIDDVEKVKIVDIKDRLISEGKDYVMDVNGVLITSSGVSIMESKDYKPVPDNERHYRKGATALEIDEYWNRILKPQKS